MTVADERIRAFKKARQFMLDLLDPSKTPRVPRSIRKRSAEVLRHFAADFQIEEIAEFKNDWFYVEPEWRKRI